MDEIVVKLQQPPPPHKIRGKFAVEVTDFRKNVFERCALYCLTTSRYTR